MSRDALAVRIRQEIAKTCAKRDRFADLEFKLSEMKTEIEQDEDRIWKMRKEAYGYTNDCQSCGNIEAAYLCHICKRDICKRCVEDESGEEDEYGTSLWNCKMCTLEK